MTLKHWIGGALRAARNACVARIDGFSRSCGLISLSLLAVCSTLSWPTSCAATTFDAATAPMSSIVDIARVDTRLPLAGQLSLLEDRTASLDAAHVLDRDRGWRPATPAALDHGDSRSAFWLAGTLVNRSTQPVTRWLSVGAADVDDICYYRLGVVGSNAHGVIESIAAGIRRPLSARPVNTALPVFPVTLAPGEQTRFVVRVQSRTPIHLDATLWAPDAFRASELHASMLEMLLDGALLTIALSTLFLGITRRDRVFLLMAASILFEIAHDLACRGDMYRAFSIDGGDWALRAPDMLSAAATVCFSAMAAAFAGLDRVPVWKWTYRAMLAALGVLCAWTGFGEFRAAHSALIATMWVCNVVWVVSMFDGWRRGLPDARIVLLALAIGCATVALPIGDLHGLLPQTWLDFDGIAWASSLPFLLMIALIAGARSHMLQREQRAAQQALLDAGTREQTRLERALDTRTHALQIALLDASDANRAKTDFLARVTHELRAPLTSIIGFADLEQAAGRDDADRGRIIRRSANQMLTMVNDLIDYADGGDPDALRLAPVYTHALFDGIARQAERVARERGHRFAFTITGALPPLLALDEKRIAQVLSNLIDNASKFTLDGRIALYIDCRHVPEISTGTHGSVLLTMSVADTGCGIAAADQARIFEPFARLDAARRASGIGLGLAIVKQWVTRMGGTLSLDSTLGVGTTVSLSVPVAVVDEAQLAADEAADPVEVLPAIDGNGRRVLIGEDSAGIRAFLVDEFSGLGFTVETVGDAMEMLARVARKDLPRPDLVVTDPMMPGIDGMIVLREIRFGWPGCPVIAVSAVVLPVAAYAGDPAGYDGCVLTPVDLAVLRGCVVGVVGEVGVLG
ncbi:7TM-DISM domain-containing protein [Paraburkholderia sp.]|uniref:hybrid sensor histidine kinase/response regulator n=1 Tax=Paraburkholderia sp. TaxID=1926495 RepID=UPI0023974FFA|nr:7TM-DISM domain-containing protein [Paraburkholderia sp.]MDE1184233.1 7TM-DISM domain-containing protein [Paraburkholderia sp.]